MKVKSPIKVKSPLLTDSRRPRAMLKRAALILSVILALSGNTAFAFPLSALTPRAQMIVRSAIGQMTQFPLVRHESIVAIESAPTDQAGTVVQRLYQFLADSPAQRRAKLWLGGACLRSLSAPEQRQSFMRGVWGIGSPEDSQLARQTIAETTQGLQAQVNQNSIQSGMISNFGDNMRHMQEQNFCITGQLPCYPRGYGESSGQGLWNSERALSNALGR